ncbi:MAG: hypothetical protein MPJ79_00380 [Alphaproteobacteria bacterium]|nr:hypothetical protein [Alphaproteobacteria bacterium]MDA7982577.1 hypothetical protein [Alphaproteobacteria bacterium]MDA8008645.1 hypothetical protein [Alphaproteobacteria bacterium]
MMRIEANEFAGVLEERAGGGLVVVAVAGAPNSGKSVFARRLADGLGEGVHVVPMDGFHLGNDVLRERGLLERKGAPETFDAAGFAGLVERVRGGERVSYPVFDRDRDVVVEDGGVIDGAARVVLFEGNYLLLRDEPWGSLVKFWDVSVWLDVGLVELERRSVERWLVHGMTRGDAVVRARGVDMVNAALVIENSHPADYTVDNN